jgi:hypothetical protein
MDMKEKGEELGRKGASTPDPARPLAVYKEKNLESRRPEKALGVLIEDVRVGVARQANREES